MLHPQTLVLQLHLPQTLQFGHRRGVDWRHLADQLAIAHFLAPARQHEGMNAQRLGNILDQHAGLITHLHRLQLECDSVPMNLLRPWCTHRTPSSLGESVNKTDSRSHLGWNEGLGASFTEERDAMPPL